MLISLLTPLLWTTWRPHWLPWPIESYIDGVHNLGQPQAWLFPIFPWTAFAFAGLAVGFLLLSDWARQREAAVFAMAGAAGVALIYLARWMDARPEQIYPVYDFWHTSPNFFLIRVGLLLAILAVTYAWCRWGAGQWGFSPLIQLGQTSLLVYWVHIEFVYGRRFHSAQACGRHSDGVDRTGRDISGDAVCCRSGVHDGNGAELSGWQKIFTAKFAGSPQRTQRILSPCASFGARSVMASRYELTAFAPTLHRGLPDRIFYQLQRNRPTLASLRFFVSVAEQVERDVEAFPNLVFHVVKAAPDQQFGGCGNFGDTFQELRNSLGELLMFLERTA